MPFVLPTPAEPLMGEISGDFDKFHTSLHREAFFLKQALTDTDPDS